MIEVACPKCAKQYRLADELAGKRVRCKDCGETITVPQPATVGASAGADEGDIPLSAPPPMPATPAPTRVVAPAVAPAASAPAATRPKRRFGFRLNRFAIALGIIGVVLFAAGLKEMRLATAASAKPQEITCLDLEKNGPGKNAYVRVTKFISTGGFVYQKKENSDAWQMVWLPIIPIDGDYALRVRKMIKDGTLKSESDLPPPDHVHVIVKSSKISSQSEVDRFDDTHDTLTGLVINQVESLSQKEKDLLVQSYPGTDLDTCWIVEEGREPASPAKYLGMMGGGAALVLAGLWLTFRPAS
jgi:predicted Zn finger-like uncharacterized protein